MRTLHVLRFVISALTIAAPIAAQTGAVNPFEPLSIAEITRVGDALRTAGRVDSMTIFISVTLVEPSKAEVAAGRSATTRQAAVLLYHRSSRTTAQAVVDLAAPKVVSW